MQRRDLAPQMSLEEAAKFKVAWAWITTAQQQLHSAMKDVRFYSQV